MASFMLRDESRILPNATAVIAVLPIAFGTLAVFRPDVALKLWEAPRFTGPARDVQTAQNLMRLWAVREFFVGAATLTAWYLDDRKLMGTLLLIGIPVAAMDGYVQRQFVPGAEWRHWPFLPVIAGIGAGLLGWLG